MAKLSTPQDLDIMNYRVYLYSKCGEVIHTTKLCATNYYGVYYIIRLAGKVRESIFLKKLLKNKNNNY